MLESQSSRDIPGYSYPSYSHSIAGSSWRNRHLDRARSINLRARDCSLASHGEKGLPSHRRGIPLLRVNEQIRRLRSPLWAPKVYAASDRIHKSRDSNTVFKQRAHSLVHYPRACKAPKCFPRSPASKGTRRRGTQITQHRNYPWSIWNQSIKFPRYFIFPLRHILSKQ